MLLSHPYVKHVICQKETTIDFDRIMSRKKILLVKLSVNLPSDIKKFIGTILLSELTHAALTRASRRQFCIYVDEIQNFATSEDFATLFTQARKFGIATTTAHQERYGQFADNKKMQGATAAAANKIFFQTTVRDAEEMAKEFTDVVTATEKRREAELVISPHAVEDIWEKGHPTPDAISARKEYLWIVDLVKTRPHETSFVFDPKRISSEINVAGDLHWEEFDDWELYRSSNNMLKQGISLLNAYYYDCMRHASDMTKPPPEEKLDSIYRVVECLSGVYGFRPVMCPFLSDTKRAFLFRLFQQSIEQFERKLFQDNREYLIEIQRTSGIFAMEQAKIQLDQKVARLRVNACNYERAIANTTTWHYCPSLFREIQSFVISLGASLHDAADLFEWKVRTPTTVEVDALRALIKILIDPNPFTKENNERRDYAVEQYISVMSITPMAGKFGADFQKVPDDVRLPYLQTVVERLLWQVNNLQVFIVHCCNVLPLILRKTPVKIPSGKYDETLTMERQQADLVHQIAQELINLPRFSAYVKLVDKAHVIKAKIRTQPLPKQNSRVHSRGMQILCHFNSWHNGYIKPRDWIEKEARARQTSWQDRPPEPPLHLEEPPPTSA
jgi:hypothetical protein